MARSRRCSERWRTQIRNLNLRPNLLQPLSRGLSRSMNNRINRPADRGPITKLAGSNPLFPVFAIIGICSPVRAGVLVARLGSLDGACTFGGDGGFDGLHAEVKVTGRLDAGSDLGCGSPFLAMVGDNAFDSSWISSKSEWTAWRWWSWTVGVTPGRTESRGNARGSLGEDGIASKPTRDRMLNLDFLLRAWVFDRKLFTRQ